MNFLKQPVLLLNLVIFVSFTSTAFAQGPYPPLQYGTPQAIPQTMPSAMQPIPTVRGYAPPPAYPARAGAPSQMMPQMAPLYGRSQYPGVNPPVRYPYAQGSPSQQPPGALNKKPLNEFSGYLGIVLDVVPSTVAAQLPKGEQGILVKSFAPDSPAANGDLRPLDVIVAYDNTKIFHPEQFVKLVRKSKPGQVIVLKVARKGEIKEIPVTIGAQKTPNPTEFNGLAIKRIGEDRYQATIRFIAPNGSKQVRSFEGNREEIFQQAMETQELPPAEREQLLYATRPRKAKSKSGFGSFFPFGGNNKSGSWMNPGKFFNW